MANLYTYAVQIRKGDFQRITFVANSQKEAEEKLSQSKMNGVPFLSFGFLSSEKFDEKNYK